MMLSMPSLPGAVLVLLWVVMVIGSLPLLIVVWELTRKRLLVAVTAAALLAMPALAHAAIVRDPCSGDIPWWYRAVIGCWY